MSAPYSRATPCPRSFECKRCGAGVAVDSRNDHRTVFCCAQCEREYWRHRDRYERRKDTARGHVVRLRREAWENRKEQGW